MKMDGCKGFTEDCADAGAARRETDWNYSLRQFLVVQPDKYIGRTTVVHDVLLKH